MNANPDDGSCDCPFPPAPSPGYNWDMGSASSGENYWPSDPSYNLEVSGEVEVPAESHQGQGGHPNVVGILKVPGNYSRGAGIPGQMAGGSGNMDMMATYGKDYPPDAGDLSMPPYVKIHQGPSGNYFGGDGGGGVFMIPGNSLDRQFMTLFPMGGMIPQQQLIPQQYWGPPEMNYEQKGGTAGGSQGYQRQPSLVMVTPESVTGSGSMPSLSQPITGPSPTPRVAAQGPGPARNTMPPPPPFENTVPADPRLPSVPGSVVTTVPKKRKGRKKKSEPKLEAEAKPSVEPLPPPPPKKRNAKGKVKVTTSSTENPRTRKVKAPVPQKPHPPQDEKPGGTDAVQEVVKKVITTTTAISTEVRKLPLRATRKSKFEGPEGGRGGDLPQEEKPGRAEQEDGTLKTRKCVVCRQMKHFTRDIYEKSGRAAPPVLTHQMSLLFNHLTTLVKTEGRPSEEGVCSGCLDQLQHWDTFYSAIYQQSVSPEALPNSTLTLEPYQARVYQNWRLMRQVKEFYENATAHRHLMRRCLLDADWDYLCDFLRRPSNSPAEAAKLNAYLMDLERLQKIFCGKCEHLVDNGITGYLDHWKSQHSEEKVTLPCDLCGGHFPQDGYFSHWIGHFYLHDICKVGEERPPVKKVVKRRRVGSVVKRDIPVPASGGEGEEVASTNSDPGHSGTKKVPGETPFKCFPCDRFFPSHRNYMAHHEAVHLQLRKYQCDICLEKFKSWKTMLNHRKTHVEDGSSFQGYKCDLCDRYFPTELGLKCHLTRHKRGSYIPDTKEGDVFECHFCKRRLSSKYVLRLHYRSHSEIKDKCPFCDWKIPNKKGYLDHFAAEHKDIKPKIYSKEEHEMLEKAAMMNALKKDVVTSAAAKEGSEESNDSGMGEQNLREDSVGERPPGPKVVLSMPDLDGGEIPEIPMQQTVEGQEERDQENVKVVMELDPDVDISLIEKGFLSYFSDVELPQPQE